MRADNIISCNVNIPYYGKSQCLREALGSVFAQTVRQDLLETTVFDDCSPEPATEHLPSSYEGRCRIVRNPSNLGMVRNWNRCLEYGENNCIHILHGDDMLDPEFYSRVLSVFERYDDVGLVHTDYRPLFTRKTSTRYWGVLLRKKPVARNKVEVFRAGDEGVRHVMKGVICSSVVLRREAASDVGLFRTDLPYSSDEEYWARIAARWAVAYVSLPLTIYRYHAHNYQLKTWGNPDFWDSFQETRRARMAHLISPTEDDIKAQSIGLARNAVGISQRLLAAGQFDWASRYLDYAIKINPQISDDHWFRRMSSWVSQGSIGRIKAWLRSSN